MKPPLLYASFSHALISFRDLNPTHFSFSEYDVFFFLVFAIVTTS